MQSSEHKTNVVNRACDYNDMVTVLVGSKQQPFTVHKSILLSKAGCYRILFRNNPVKVAYTTWSKPETVKTYVHWVYTDKFDLASAERPGNQPAQEDAEQSLLLELYVVSETLLDELLGEKVSSLLTAGTDDWMFSIPLMLKVYEFTSSKSRLRRELVDQMIRKTPKDSFPDFLAKLPAQMVQDIAVALMEQMQSKKDPKHSAENGQERSERRESVKPA